MKVLLLVSSFPPEVRSQSTLMYELAVDLVKAGHQVGVVTAMPRYSLPSGAGDAYKGRHFVREQMEGVDVMRLPVLPVPRRVPLMRGLEHFVLAFQFLAGSLPMGRPDVTLVYSPPLPLGLAAHWIGRLRGAPVVVNVQDIYPQTAIDLGLLKNRALIRVAEWTERFIYRNAARVTVHSQGNREVLLKRGAAPERVRVISNWVDTQQIRPGQRLNGFRQQHELGDKFIISFAGTMGYAQGLDTVLEAAHLLKDHHDILFLMVGDGSFKEALVKRARELELTNTTFLPMVPVEEYPHVLAASDVSLVTLAASVNTPVVPAKLLSIMASGRPVVASVPGAGDTRQIVDTAQCGQWVPPGDATALGKSILELYQDPQAMKCQGEKGRAFAEAHLSRKGCVAQYEALLREVAGEKSSNAYQGS